MKIDKQSSPSKFHPFPGRNLGWIIALAMMFALGVATASDKVHDLWITTSRRLRSRLASAPQSFITSPTSTEGFPTLAINIDFASYTNLLEQRARALQRGIYIPAEQDYDYAEIWVQGTNVPVEIRMAGPVEHLGDDDKWGFEILAEDDGHILGMHHCYLLDPAVNNGLNEWAFVQALAHEGILAARYQFVRLIFNGDDRGIYALQEEPDATSLTTEQRSAMSSHNQTSNNQDQQSDQGIVVKFDTQTLRRSIAHFQGDVEAAYADPVSNLAVTAFQYLELAPYRDAALTPDPTLAPQREQVLGKLRELQTGARSASEVFDVDAYGRFLALVDLWGATQATSPLNLHYYYTPNNRALEPVSFNANALGSDKRIDLTLTYNDPAIQAAYTREAERISQPAYLRQLRETLEPELVRVQQLLMSEYPTTVLPWADLRQNQAQIQRSLNPVQPVSAYLGDPVLSISGTLRVEVGNVLNLPVEIVGFDIAGAIFLIIDHQWVSSESDSLLLDMSPRGEPSVGGAPSMGGAPSIGGGPEAVVLRAVDASQTPIVVQYADIDIPLTEIHRRDQEIDLMHEPDIQVVTRILGLTHTQRTLARSSYNGE
jgi:hypothetical protein